VLSNREKLQALLKQRKRVNQSERERIEVEPDATSAPLSPGQQGFWFFNEYMGPNAVYNMVMTLGCHDNLRIDALQQSLAYLATRHSVLRTRFSEQDGAIIQTVDHDIEVPHLESCDNVGQMQSCIEQEHAYLFDLTSTPLCRFRLLENRDSIRAGTPRYLLIVNMHHSISDGWSLGIFYRELLACYTQITEGAAQHPELPELALQYLDYSRWQRTQLSGDKQQPLLDYWRNELTGVPELLTLPTDRPRPAVQTFNGRTRSLRWSESLTTSLKAWCSSENVTLFSCLISALSVLLGRYAQQDDIAIGTPIANRPQKALESLLGFFSNTLFKT